MDLKTNPHELTKRPRNSLTVGLKNRRFDFVIWILEVVAVDGVLRAPHGTWVVGDRWARVPVTLNPEGNCENLWIWVR